MDWPSTVSPQPFVKYIRWHITGNILLAMISVLGFIGNCIVLYIYAKHRAFQTKSFILLINLTVVDLLSSLVFGSLAIFRMVVIFTATVPTWSPMLCILASTPQRICIMVSTANELAVAVDRLVFMANPMLHRCRLGKKYNVALVSLAWLRAVPYLAYWYWDSERMCSFELPYRSHYSAMEWTDICFCTLTACTYVAALVAGRRTLYESLKSMLMGGPNGIYLIPNVDRLMRRYAIAQHRIFRVALVITTSFVCTSFLAALVNVLLKYNKVTVDFRNAADPFNGVAFVFNSADTVLINFWRDWVFREKLTELFSRKIVQQNAGDALPLNEPVQIVPQ